MIKIVLTLFSNYEDVLISLSAEAREDFIKIFGLYKIIYSQRFNYNINLISFKQR